MISLCDAIDPPSEVDGVKLLWTDIPFGTGKIMQRGENSYEDHSDIEYVLLALQQWASRMDDDGTIVICCDYRASFDVKLALSREPFPRWKYRGEIIWEFGLGRPRLSWWPVRHNNLLTFTRTEHSGMFDPAAVPRTKRLAPKPGYPDDKPAGSVWDFTMSNTHPQRVGYPNQKPVEIIAPFVLAHTSPGDLVADPFCGSGTTGVVAASLGRRYWCGDSSPNAVDIARERIEVGT